MSQRNYRREHPYLHPFAYLHAHAQVNGVARFTDLMIENESRHYRLQYLAGPLEAPLQVCDTARQRACSSAHSMFSGF